jgi:hypothetical protein
MTWKGIVGQRFTAVEFATYVETLAFPGWRPSLIVVHNTQIPTLATWQAVPGERWMRSLERYYRDEQGWSGGPHLFIEPGGIWVFTPLTVPGVHSPSWNGSAWGVEIVGDFDREPFTAEGKDTVLNALTALHRRMEWTEPRLRLHKEDPKTTHTGCPGAAIDKIELETKVQFMLALNIPTL